MLPLSIQTAHQAISATQTIRTYQTLFVFRPSFANKHSQNDNTGKATKQSRICPPLFCNQSEDYCQNKIYPQNSIQSVPPSTPYISGTTLNMVHICTLFSKSLLHVHQLHQFPSGPTYTRKHYKFFGFTKAVWFEREKHFKPTWRKGLRVPSRANLRWYYLRVSTLTANKSPPI